MRSRPVAFLVALVSAALGAALVVLSWGGFHWFFVSERDGSLVVYAVFGLVCLILGLALLLVSASAVRRLRN